MAAGVEASESMVEEYKRRAKEAQRALFRYSKKKRRGKREGGSAGGGGGGGGEEEGGERSVVEKEKLEEVHLRVKKRGKGNERLRAAGLVPSRKRPSALRRAIERSKREGDVVGEEEEEAGDGDEGEGGADREVLVEKVGMERDKCVEECMQWLCVEAVARSSLGERKMRDRDLAKAKIRPRVVAGLRQVHQSVRVKQALVVIIAKDIARVPGPKGIDAKIDAIRTDALTHEIPVILNGPPKKLLSHTLARGKAMVSAVAITSNDGPLAKIITDIKKLLSSAPPPLPTTTPPHSTPTTPRKSPKFDVKASPFTPKAGD